VISVESNFDHAAVSQKGAQGLMQLMPATASLMGVRDPHNPDENIDAGASHLRAMLDTFKGDLPLALAAYNAGEQNVIRHRGIPPFPETRQFVTRVLRRMGDQKGAETVMAKPVPPGGRAHPRSCRAPW
jgi:soluble lytic murein transglycosylase